MPPTCVGHGQDTDWTQSIHSRDQFENLKIKIKGKMSNSNTNSIWDSSHTQSIDDNAPLWKYVTKVESNKKAQGNISFKYHYCQSIFQWSCSRVKYRLLKIKGGGIRSCNKVTQSNLSEMKRLVDEAKLKIKTTQARITISLPTSSRAGSSSARAFDLDFDMNEFRPMGYNALRTTLLQKEKSHLDMKLELIKNAWKVNGVSMCSDGWSDSQRRPLINMVLTCDNGPMFFKAINCEGDTKNTSFIANLLDECICEIGL
ncbi:hypothetical protein GBA52_019901 [Prunus armeniaca]|nr:hypothetical protein GBA52_019901 [Prunus armeniaca]